MDIGKYKDRACENISLLSDVQARWIVEVSRICDFTITESMHWTTPYTDVYVLVHQNISILSIVYIVPIHCIFIHTGQ